MEGDSETTGGNNNEQYIQGKNVKYVLFGIIVVLLIMNLLQFRELMVAQDTIDLLGKHVAELQKKK